MQENLLFSPAILGLRQITPDDKLVLALLTQRVAWSGLPCSETDSELAQLIWVDEASVSRAIRRCLRLGLVEDVAGPESAGQRRLQPMASLLADYQALLR